ncbi:splicing factor, CC1-like protein [Nadsonia fulvescens var. elongata DSM 6958]|uniref:Splicing factor, CC1-like protein n=1 Tax=Nadsonia fulvescens var. elongata DSM 6958 TaxID=857566 RepID=A0A1E3PEN7_9ASCO|nr:splicing factor, CC1-like protein [Nadsonia fulvescens var. elongata DSM 6958]
MTIDPSVISQGNRDQVVVAGGQDTTQEVRHFQGAHQPIDQKVNLTGTIVAIPDLIEVVGGIAIVTIIVVAVIDRRHHLFRYPLQLTAIVGQYFQVGDVCDASIVRDKVTNRSKGVAYVEFAQMESVARAIQLTGNKLLGIPVIVQHTESEKNRLALEAAGNPQIKETAEDKSAHIPAFNTPSKSGLQIYVGNIYFGITEEELKMIFQAFGEIEYVNVQRDETGRSKGYAFVKYRHEDHAKEALLKMNGFVLAGRNLKVGVGVADKNAASMIQSLGNSFVQNTHTNPLTSVQTSSQSPVEPKTNEAMESAKPMSREALMRKLMREDDNLLNPTNKSDLDQDTRPVPIIVSRCVALQNMFDPSEESGTTWTTELLEDVKAECEAKYGKVVHIQIDAQSPKGEIFAKFDTPESAKRALEDLNGRYFGGKQISATSMVEMVYTLRFPKSKDL